MARRAFWLLLLGLALGAAASIPRGAAAAPILLEDGVGFVEIDPASQDGAFAWTVNGVQHVRTQWFWAGGSDRQGAPTAEASVDGLFGSATPSDTNGDGRDDTLDVELDALAGLGISLHLRYQLVSTPIGGANEYVSQLVTDLTYSSLEGPIAARLFSYADVDLFGSYADDVAAFLGGDATVTDASGLGSYESRWDRAPDAVEAAHYDTTLASLNDATGTVLSGATNAAGDVTLAAMWNVEIPAGERFTLRNVQTIRVVPEPGVATLVALGLAALAARRKETVR